VQFADHGLLGGFSPVNATLRKLPRVGTNALAPKHLIFLVEQDDADVGSKAVPVKHNQTPIFKLSPLCTASAGHQAALVSALSFPNSCHESLPIPHFHLKEAPADAEVVSHKLMMRAGMIKKLGAGIYTYMPMGLRVIRKVEAIVREEMNRAGAVELTMPVVQPAELWQETGRFEKMGPELLRIKDRHGRDFVCSPPAKKW
jgi:hypothetical protein